MLFMVQYFPILEMLNLGEGEVEQLTAEHKLLMSSNDMVAMAAQLEQILESYTALPVTLLDGQSHTAMAAADIVLMASGTTALEALLLKKPMVVGYKVAELSYQLLRFMVKIPWLSLPNLLTGRELVPEFIRKKPTVDNLSEAVLSLLNNPAAAAALSDEFLSIHRQLRCNANERAADAVGPRDRRRHRDA